MMAWKSMPSPNHGGSPGPGGTPGELLWETRLACHHLTESAVQSPSGIRLGLQAPDRRCENAPHHRHIRAHPLGLQGDPNSCHCNLAVLVLHHYLDLGQGWGGVRIGGWESSFRASTPPPSIRRLLPQSLVMNARN